VNGKSSTWSHVLSGIPQGSVLGPILFVIFINDLPEVVSSTAKIFADDTKLFSSVMTEDDHKQLQNDLNSLIKWSEDWQLGFNESKCKVIHLGHNNSKRQYQMNAISLSVSSEEKDLGIIIDNELKYHKHIANAVNKASRILGLIKATFTTRDEITIPRLFMSMVRPHLEYGNVIWSPRYKMNTVEIEKVQRRATKINSYN